MVHLIIVAAGGRKHGPFTYESFAVACEMRREALASGLFRSVEGSYIQLGAGTILHIISDTALEEVSTKGLALGDVNLVITQPDGRPLPPLPYSDVETALRDVRLAVQTLDHKIVCTRIPEHEMFTYIAAPGTVYALFSRAECIKLLTGGTPPQEPEKKIILSS